MTPTLFPFHYRLLLIRSKVVLGFIPSVRTHPGKVTSQCNVCFWAVEDTETQCRRKQKCNRGSPKSSEPSSDELSALTGLNTCFWQITPQWLQFLLTIRFLKHAFKSQKLAPDRCQENANVATILNFRISVLNTLLPWVWSSSYSKIIVYINFYLKLSFLQFIEIPSSFIPPTQKS